MLPEGLLCARHRILLPVEVPEDTWGRKAHPPITLGITFAGCDRY